MYHLLKYVLLCLVNLPAYLLLSQQPLEIPWSEAFSMQRNDHHHKVLTADSSGVYVISLHNNYSGPFNPGTPLIDRIDWNFKRVSTAVLAGFSKTDSINYEDVVNVKGNCYLIYNREVSKNYFVFYAQSLDYQQNRLINAPLTISDTVRNLQLEDDLFPFFISTYRRGFETMGFDYLIKGDKIAFIYYKNLQNFTLAVYNRKMKLLWRTKYSLPFDKRTTGISSFALSVSGTVVVYLKQTEKPFKNLNFYSPDQYQHFALLLHGNDDDGHLYSFKTDKAFLNRMDFEEEPDGMMKFTSYYSEKEFNRAYGIVQYVIDPFTQKISTLGPLPFSDQTLARLKPHDDEEKSRSIPCPTYLNYVAPRKEILLEFFDLTGAGTVENAAILRFDSTSQNWQAIVIPKKQALDATEYYSEYLSLSAVGGQSGATYLFYNDHVAGKDPKIRVGKIDPQNEFHSVAAAPAAEIQSRILPQSIYYYKNKALILAESPLHNRYYFGIVDAP